MKRYLLIEDAEREIGTPTIFQNKDAALKYMTMRVCKIMGYSFDDVFKELERNQVFNDDDVMIDYKEETAYINCDASPVHMNFDWAVHEIEPDAPIDDQFALLSALLMEEGKDAIENFIGKQMPRETKVQDLIYNTYVQMPEDVLNMYFKKYKL